MIGLNNSNCSTNCSDNVDFGNFQSGRALLVILFGPFILICCCFTFMHLFGAVEQLFKWGKETCTCLKKSVCHYKTNVQINNLNDTYSFVVKNCTVIKPNSELVEGGGEDCSICIEKLLVNNENKLLKINKCKHIFHLECIYPWFNEKYTSHNQVDCPLCRQSIDTISINIPNRSYSDNSESAFSYSEYD